MMSFERSEVVRGTEGFRIDGGKRVEKICANKVVDGKEKTL